MIASNGHKMLDYQIMDGAKNLYTNGIGWMVFDQKQKTTPPLLERRFDTTPVLVTDQFVAVAAC